MTPPDVSFTVPVMAPVFAVWAIRLPGGIRHDRTSAQNNSLIEQAKRRSASSTHALPPIGFLAVFIDKTSYVQAAASQGRSKPIEIALLCLGSAAHNRDLTGARR